MEPPLDDFRSQADQGRVYDDEEVQRRAEEVSVWDSLERAARLGRKRPRLAYVAVLDVPAVSSPRPLPLVSNGSRANEVDPAGDLVRADAWQLAQAQEAWRALRDGRLDLAPPDALARVFREAEERATGRAG